MEPLDRVMMAQEQRLLSSSVVKRIIRRMKYVEEGVERIEKASGLKYPPYYVEPTLPLSSSGFEFGHLGVMFARTLPVKTFEGLEIWIEISAPLVAFATRNTIHAVLVHEFLHYVELGRRFIKYSFTSDQLSSSLYESVYLDYDRLYEPRLILKDRGLMRLLKTRFPAGLVDEDLIRKTEKMWLEKSYPSKTLPPDSNILKVPVQLILKANFDPNLKTRLDELDRMSLRNAAKI